MSSNSTKKKMQRNCLEFNQKLEILDRLDSGEAACDIARIYSIAPSTVSMIKSRREIIEKRKAMLTSCQGNLKKKRFRGTEESPLETAVFKWMSETNHTGVPVGSAALQRVALNVHKDLNIGKNFTASPGWIRRFRDRHDIRVRKINGKKSSANIEASEAFKTSFDGLMRLANIDNLECIYNCDETALYWKLLPSKTFTVGAEKGSSGFKKSKSRITVMLCTNASGSHKIPLHIIGKFQKPQCSNEMEKYPIKYSSQPRAWMNQKIMMDWYENLFIPEVKKRHNYEENKDLKVILLMNNAPCHPTTDVFHQLNDFCTIIYLPPNTTSILHPMDQGIIKKFKRCYRHALLSDLLINKSSFGFANAYKSLQLSDAFQYSMIGWEALTETDIRKCWRNLIPLDDDSPVSGTEVSGSGIHQLLSMLPGCENISVKYANEWLKSDQYESCFGIESSNKSPVSDNGSIVISKSETDSECEEELEYDEDISLKDVYDAIKLISRWSLKSDDENINNATVQLIPIRNYVVDKLLCNNNN